MVIQWFPISYSVLYLLSCFRKWKWKSLLYGTVCDPMNYTVHGILWARILEWLAFPFSRGSSQPRDRTQVSCIAGRFFTSWATREAPEPVNKTEWHVSEATLILRLNSVDAILKYHFFVSKTILLHYSKFQDSFTSNKWSLVVNYKII